MYWGESTENNFDWDAGRNMNAILSTIIHRVQSKIETILKSDAAPFDPIRHFSQEKNAFPKSVKESHRDYFLNLKEKRKAREKKKSKQGRIWVSVLTQNEDEFIRAQVEAKIANVGKKYKKQAAEKLDWVKQGNKVSNMSLQRLEHLLHMVQEEQQKELQREIQLQNFKCDPHEFRQVEFRIFRDRSEFGDSMMDLLHAYRLVSGKEMAEYLGSCNNKCEEQLSALPTVSTMPPISTRASTSCSHTRPRAVSKSSATRNVLEKFKGGDFQKRSLGALQRRQLESVQVSSPSLNESRPHSHQVRSRSDIKAKQNKNIHWGGWGNRISYQAEKILDGAGTNASRAPRSFKGAKHLLGQRVDKMEANSVYSFILNRGLK